jgi:prepilin-type N-terminal cleavage/methylation domain-containing protein
VPGVSRSVCARSAGRAKGFTLLEILVVVSILALATALVSPSVLATLEGARERQAVEAVRNVVQGLPLAAFRSGAAVQVDAAQLRARLDEWPAGFTLVIESDGRLEYSPEGAARGGVYRIVDPRGRVTRWKVEPLSGNVTLTS